MIKSIAVLWILVGLTVVVNVLTYPDVPGYTASGLFAYVMGIMLVFVPVFLLPFWLAWRK